VKGDQIVCERHDDDLEGFLTVHSDRTCKLSYNRTRVGKQFGQFWLLDERQNQELSRTLISIQVHVLENIVCNSKAVLVVQNQQSRINQSSIKLSQSVSLLASLNPNCLKIQPQDQTITELTTMCKNSFPRALANGGIEMTFQCTPRLCRAHQVCFIGEFGVKLPSTAVQCVRIDVTSTGM
jgi:hypothetical protein